MSNRFHSHSVFQTAEITSQKPSDHEWLDEDESEMSENIEILTEFLQKRIRKVKKKIW